MAKTPASTLVTDLCKRLDLNPGAVGDGSADRTDMLRQLNISQQQLTQEESLSFMLADDTLTLNSAASSAAVPSTIDVGKGVTLGRASGDGEIEWVPPDEWYRTHLDTYRMPSQAAPSYFTIARVSSVSTFLFKPPNTSGGPLTIPYKAHIVATALTDATDSLSVLPEGWENTILLDLAELELRKLNGEPIPEYLPPRVRDGRKALYANYRTTKEQPMTDREQAERKQAREVFAPEKP